MFKQNDAFRNPDKKWAKTPADPWLEELGRNRQELSPPFWNEWRHEFSAFVLLQKSLKSNIVFLFKIIQQCLRKNMYKINHGLQLSRHRFLDNCIFFSSLHFITISFHSRAPASSRGTAPTRTRLLSSISCCFLFVLFGEEVIRLMIIREQHSLFFH